MMKWAVVAGGSKGLGFSLAKALAGHQYHLLLIARNEQDLMHAREQLRSQYPVQVEIFACDLSLPEATTKAFEFCITKNLNVNFLCNAAGLGGAQDFQNLPLSAIRTMIATNFESPVALSFVFLPLLKQSAPSFILNIGSLAGFSPIPVKTVYASSKAALCSFSYSLKSLLKPVGISVTCACPGPIFTKPEIEQETIRQLGWFGKQMAVTADRAGEAIIKSALKRKMIVVPGKWATLVSYLLRMIPAPWINRLMAISGKKPG